MENRPRVAIIGTGRMGGAMAGTLARDGFEVTLWNRTREIVAEIADGVGAEIADTPADAARKTDVVLSSLADDEAVLAVYLGDDGIAAGVGPGQVVLEMSTIDPDTVGRIGPVVDATGARLLDSPVSGSVSTVEAGTLTVMVGGESPALDLAGPILDSLATKVVHVGARGTGAATKLAVNALVHGLNVALSEALVLAEKAGVDRSVAYEVFAGGAGGAPFVHYKREAYEHPGQAAVAFSLDLVAKDLELITGLGRRVGARMDQAQAGLDLVRRAIAAGFGEEDLSAIAVYLRRVEGEGESND